MVQVDGLVPVTLESVLIPGYIGAQALVAPACHEHHSSCTGTRRDVKEMDQRYTPAH